jgi:hypothetical protein
MREMGRIGNFFPSSKINIKVAEHEYEEGSKAEVGITAFNRTT